MIHEYSIAKPTYVKLTFEYFDVVLFTKSYTKNFVISGLA